MEVTGMLKKITSSFISKVESAGSLIAKTAGTCIFFNFTASDQYLAIVVPGRMFSKEFKDRGLKPENLSRALEDSGTVTSPLIPWNTCGAVHGGVLGITAGSYWMFCFFQPDQSDHDHALRFLKHPYQKVFKRRNASH